LPGHDVPTAVRAEIGPETLESAVTRAGAAGARAEPTGPGGAGTVTAVPGVGGRVHVWRMVLLLGVLAACSTYGEGSVTDWGRSGCTGSAPGLAWLRLGTPRSHGVAIASTLGYGGFLLGPPAIGFLAGTLGLGPSLATVSFLAVVAVAIAWFVTADAKQPHCPGKAEPAGRRPAGSVTLTMRRFRREQRRP
jgi:hypothetical protein